MTGLSHNAPLSRAGAAGADRLAEPLAGLNAAQRAAVLHHEGPLLVLAGAGSGKTRVLTTRIAHLVERHGVDPREILAVTFTNKAAGEMRERLARLLGQDPAGMWVGTFHAIGARLLRIHAPLVGRTASFTIYDEDDALGRVRRVMERQSISHKEWAPKAILASISDAKNALVSPAEYERLASDAFSRVVAKVYNELETDLRAQNAATFDDLLALPVRILRENPPVLEQYRRRFRHILVDEYQDTNRAQYQFVTLLAGGHGNVCVVGDDDQCLVRGTPVLMADGTVRGIEDVSVGDHVHSARGSGRFGAARVLRVHAKRHCGEAVAITVEDAAGARRRIVSTPEHTHFAGFMPGETPKLHFVYLMYRRGVGFRVGTTQMYTAGQKQPVPGYQLRVAHERGDALWIIGVHDDETAARLDEYLVSLRYELPTLPFVPRLRGRGTAPVGLVHDAALLRKVFASIDTPAGAERLLAERGLSMDAPHYRPRSRSSSRRNVVLTLCGDRRGARPMHRISVVGNDEAGRSRLEERGLGVRAVRARGESWRHETARASYAELLEEVDEVRAAFEDVNVIRVARLGRARDGHDTNSLPFTPAGSVVRGMVMFGADGGLVRVVATERVTLDDWVYDLDVEDTHNYVAEGVVTHNSIYGWRGADIRNILDFERDFPKATIVRLEENYRSAAPILEMANAVIQANAGRMGKTLRPTRGGGERVTLVRSLDERDEADWVAEEIATRRGASRGLELRHFAVLYRTNAQSRPLEEAFRKRQIPYRLVGAVRFYDRREIRDLVSYLKLVANPADDEAFARAVAVPKRGVGDTSVDALEAAARAAGVSMLEASARPDLLKALRPAARSALGDFAGLVNRFREQAREAAVDELLRDLVSALRYGDYLKSEGPGWEDRRDNVQALIDSAAETVADEEGEVGLTPLDHFLQRAMLVAGTDQLDPSADAVTMMTIHNAKGLEFPYVFITGLEDGLFPLSKSFEDPRLLEEERRLFYVGITRAERKLYVLHASQRRRNGELMRSAPSRFLRDVPEGMLEERKTLPFRTQAIGFGSDAGYGAGYGGAGRWGQRGSAGFAPGRGERPGRERISDFSFDDFADARPTSRRAGQPVALPTSAADAAESQDTPAIGVGARVRHRKFGAGTIAALTGTGRDAKARIDFDDEDVGQKTLVLAQANLEPADEGA